MLIGRNTFSSAELNAEELKTKNGAILIGSPTGQKPNAYGEVQAFELPHSKIKIGYSTKYFYRSDEDPESLMPDVLVEQSSEDLFSGRDVVLEAALDYAP